jgi:hypothetical protein
MNLIHKLRRTNLRSIGSNDRRIIANMQGKVQRFIDAKA